MIGSSIERIAVGALVFAVSILSIVGILGIWEILDSSIVWKSYTTIGVLGIVALLIIGIARVSSRYYTDAPSAPQVESGAWKEMRNFTLGITGAAFICFALLAILAIWDFVGTDALTKAIESMVLLFASAIINLVAFRSQIDITAPAQR